jgi:hypothetical protein
MTSNPRSWSDLVTNAFGSESEHASHGGGFGGFLYLSFL